MLSALLLASAMLATPESAKSDQLRSVAEQSGFTQTGRYAEVVDLCQRFVARYPAWVRCESFGDSPEGRPMQLLIVSRSGQLDPAGARAANIPVLMFQGGIHAGEIDGKDAGFWALREMLEDRAAASALDKVVVIFVPVFNVDGHERFGAWNRPNQRGPEQMGWRTTAQNYNLNRDYMKAESLEMQHMLRLLNRWDPIAFADLHATNGAKFEHDISIMVEPNHAGLPAMRKAGRELRDRVIDALSERGSLPVPFYPSFVTYDDPSSGFKDGPGTPRFSLSYVGLRQRFSMLVETHSWKPYPARVRSTFNTIVALTELASRQGKQWRALADAADRRVSRLAGQSVPVAYDAEAQSRMIEFRGFAYTRTPSAVSGALMTRYDESQPQLWRVPLWDQIKPSRLAQLPGYAYVIPAAHAGWLGPKLALHGIKFQTLTKATDDVRAERFTATTTTLGTQSFEGRQMLAADGSWSDTTLKLQPGSLVVHVQGNNGHLLAALLDPQAPDSYLSWGFFNNHFEAKEYMEPYVAEEVAQEMLQQRPEVAAAFNQRLATEPEFAANPQARLEFFYRLHSSWDEQKNVYPIIRINDPVDDKGVE